MSRLRESPATLLNRERSQSAGSNNSIEGEFNHFRPILSAPRSPPKRLADGTLIEPRLVKPNQSKRLFGAGNIAEFLKKHDLHEEHLVADRKSLSSVAETQDESSQSLLATEEGQDEESEELSPTLLLVEKEESAAFSGGSRKDAGKGAAVHQTGSHIDTQSLINILDKGKQISLNKCSEVISDP